MVLNVELQWRACSRPLPGNSRFVLGKLDPSNPRNFALPSSKYVRGVL